uniref:Cullin family profile domain-containing protein n=1 Tax=Hyaloperonospora arabidopsidis (strain Emoy2) TaxID=559515 RepID=M4BJY0_HYAAE
MRSGLHIDRELLWRKLFAFDDDDTAEDSSPACDEDVTHHLCRVIQTAVDHGRATPLRAMLLQRLGYWLRSDVVPEFWRFFDTLLAESEHGRHTTPRSRRQMARLCTQQLTLALQFAEEAFAHCVQLASLFDVRIPLPQLQSTDKNEPTMVQEVRTSFRCLVFDDVHALERFEELLCICFSRTWSTFIGQKKTAACIRDARSIQQTLQQLAWLPVAESALVRVLHAQVKKAVVLTCGQVFDEQLLGRVEHWGRVEMLPWLEELLLLSEEDDDDSASRTKWRQRLARQVLKEFASLRIAQLFEIIKEFPDSVPALEDLRQCLERTQQQDELVRSFRDSLQSRLLQPGANTSAILEIYVSIIKDISPDLWEPDPIEADPSKTSRSRSSDDILRILVSIYGSRELFVHEYRMMLADRLLQNLKYDTDRDVQTLELLKLRFGEESLQQCEIMVRDIEDSKRLNVNVRSSTDGTVAEAATAGEAVNWPDHTKVASLYVDATIVSRQFWPPLQGEDFALHPSVLKQVVAFTNSYHVLRNPRSLNWNCSLGSVRVRWLDCLFAKNDR